MLFAEHISGELTQTWLLPALIAIQLLSLPIHWKQLANKLRALSHCILRTSADTDTVRVSIMLSLCRIATLANPADYRVAKVVLQRDSPHHSPLMNTNIDFNFRVYFLHSLPNRNPGYHLIFLLLYCYVWHFLSKVMLSVALELEIS